MRIMCGMSTRLAMSTTTTRTTRIGLSRLYSTAVRNLSVAQDYSGLLQGTEILAEKQNNIPVMFESSETTDYSRRESLISYDALWYSMLRCRRGVSWKPSVKQFCLNAPLEILNMHRKLTDGTWRNGRPKKIIIAYPKKREGLSIRFPDRVYQRSVNDNVLYPEMVKHFIYDNCACQKGKGTDFARKRLKQHLWNFYSHDKTSGYILQIDLSGYYPNMRHDVVKNYFGRYLNADVHKMICDVLDQQYVGDVGYNPGSQMVQIAGISILNPLDHFIKERLHVKHYLRYMDDFILIHESKEYLEYCLTQIGQELNKIGFSFNEKKTHIKPLSQGFEFLGFNYRITKTGKIIMFINSNSVKHERKKLYRMFAKGVSQDKIDECYSSWKAHAKHGNSYTLLRRMDVYFNMLRSKEL